MRPSFLELRVAFVRGDYFAQWYMGLRWTRNYYRGIYHLLRSFGVMIVGLIEILLSALTQVLFALHLVLLGLAPVERCCRAEKYIRLDFAGGAVELSFFAFQLCQILRYFGAA